MGCHALLKGIFPTHGWNPCLLHCRRIIYCLSHEGSPRILEWVAYPFSRVSSQPLDHQGGPRSRLSDLSPPHLARVPEPGLPVMTFKVFVIQTMFPPPSPSLQLLLKIPKCHSNLLTTLWVPNIPPHFCLWRGKGSFTVRVRVVSVCFLPQLTLAIKIPALVRTPQRGCPRESHPISTPIHLSNPRGRASCFYWSSLKTSSLLGGSGY